MMSLTKYELKKIVCSPIVITALAVVLFINIYFVLFGSQQGYKAIQSPFDTNISQLQENGSLFAGEINDEWYQKHMAEQQKLINNPANQISDEEKEEIRKDLLLRGYTEQQIEEMGGFIYLKPEVISSNDYDKYEDVEVAAEFYNNAQQCGKMFAYEYRNLYSGEKGEILAEKAEQMYGELAEDYKAYYNYDWGYWKLRNIHSSYPFTIGLFVLIGLSPMFSAEYSRKTDAIILSSKNGKSKLIFAKLKAGLIFAVAVWALIEIINTLTIAGIYGVTGAEAYWQNFFMDYAPFRFNQLQITLVTIATSLLGIVFLACIILFVSVCCKNQFASLLIGGVILLCPCLDFAFTDNAVVQKIFNFMPTRLLTGVNIWQGFDLTYLFKQAIPTQYVILTVAVLVSIVAAYLCVVIFKHRQVEN